MEKKEEGRYAVLVDGIAITGFDSMSEAETAIDENPEWRKRRAVATELTAGNLNGKPREEHDGIIYRILAFFYSKLRRLIVVGHYLGLD